MTFWYTLEPSVVFGDLRSVQKVRCHPDGPIQFAYVPPPWFLRMLRG